MSVEGEGGVEVESVKPAESGGKGIVIRAYSLDSPAAVRITAPWIRDMSESNITEDDGPAIQGSEVHFKKFEIKTLFVPFQAGT
ncbi:hypothetical protein [Thermogymnomonas acidicola]|uniref:glycosyl hydrolase-related protein n=1 Tax=Thermogymnomonas acidicola TaxID=399579 RepID=UPI0009461E7A|nr:glycosyl hydrolase-related protein [Thermogymnomonas acidicola]